MYQIGEFNDKDNGRDFVALLKELEKIKGIERYRISSIEPNLITDEIINFVKQSKKFMPHFHIPLQSGSDIILSKMKRRYKNIPIGWSTHEDPKEFNPGVLAYACGARLFEKHIGINSKLSNRLLINSLPISIRFE